MTLFPAAGFEIFASFKEDLNIDTANTLVYDPVLASEENALLSRLGNEICSFFVCFLKGR
jgi:hypothetical protein